MLTKESIVAKANEVLRSELDARTERIKRLIVGHDLVFAVWQDPTEHDGVGTRIIKGIPGCHLDGDP
jgi:hypothetical protein